MSEMIPSANGPKVGWLCSFVPEEVILAAGLTPIRVNGRMESVKMADAFTPANLCPMLKNVMDTGLRSGFSDLAGLILAHSCDGARRMADLWPRYVDFGPRVYFLEIPKKRDEEAILYFADRLRNLSERIGRDFQVETSQSALQEAVAFMNRRRRLMTDLVAGQKARPPARTGLELLDLLSAESSLPKAETAIRLEEAVAGLPARAPQTNNGPRIMIIGNVLNRPTLIELLEGCGGLAVLLDNCQGLQHYSLPVDETQPPFLALARRYLEKPSCARMPGVDARLERLMTLIKDYHVQGVIYSSLKRCDFGLFETPAVARFLGDRKVPFLVLENDYLWGDVERLRVRVEAFIEMIGEEF